ncbi:MAG: ArsC/Spx/MgsR family protein [Pseudomonadota bacterium]
MRIYGLKACDSCRKAAKLLGAPITDVRDCPLSDVQLDAFLAQFGQALVNQRSTTWRSLTEDERSANARDLLRQYPALMKRPVIEDDAGALYLGWGAEVRERVL